MKSHYLPAKSYVLPLYDKGKKLEVRVVTTRTKKILTGDIISPGKEIQRQVIAIRIYPTFEKMLYYEDERQIGPGVPEEKILKHLYNTYPDNTKEVIVFELR